MHAISSLHVDDAQGMPAMRHRLCDASDSAGNDEALGTISHVLASAFGIAFGNRIMLTPHALATVAGTPTARVAGGCALSFCYCH